MANATLLLVRPLVELLGTRGRYVAEVPSDADLPLDLLREYVFDAWPRSDHWSKWLFAEYNMRGRGRRLYIDLGSVELAPDSPFSFEDEDAGACSSELHGPPSALTAARRDYLTGLLAKQVDDELARTKSRISSPSTFGGTCPICAFPAGFEGYCRLHEDHEKTAEGREAKLAWERARAEAHLQELLEFLASPLPPIIVEEYYVVDRLMSFEFKLELDPPEDQKE